MRLNSVKTRNVDQARRGVFHADTDQVTGTHSELLELACHLGGASVQSREIETPTPVHDGQRSGPLDDMPLKE